MRIIAFFKHLQKHRVVFTVIRGISLLTSPCFDLDRKQTSYILSVADAVVQKHKRGGEDLELEIKGQLQRVEQCV